MGGITIKDLRPFLTQVLEHGVKSGQLKDPFFKKAEQEGVDLTIGFAKKYYDIVHEENLRKAMQNVVGIISLGLAFKFSQDIEKASIYVQSEGLIIAFRLGWGHVAELTRISKLLEDPTYTNSAWQINKEIELSELVSATNQNEWFGDQLFSNKFQEINNIFQERYAYPDWLIRQFSRTPHLAKIAQDKKSLAFSTVLISTILDSGRSTTLNKEQSNMIMRKLVLESAKTKEKLEKGVELLKQQLPEKWGKFIDNDTRFFFGKGSHDENKFPVTLADIQNFVKRRDLEFISSWWNIWFVSTDSAGEIVELEIETKNVWKRK
ncbi:hypothetical protein ISS03_00665 [Patescibacteria group bacterium]|nr:hypothetical protein [Patescibacteria group bacterium]